jgi:ABC-2 type transport system permease protein
VITAGRAEPLAVMRSELGKLPAFVRRDFLVAWSYRFAFFTDIGGLISGVFMFYFVGRMVNPAVLPTYGGVRTTYMEFAAVGIALGVFTHIGMDRVAGAIRGEQLKGTLESLLMTPTSPSTIQFGSVIYDLIYVPLRTALFLLVIALSFGLRFHSSGFAPAALFLLLYIPFVWGLGIMAAALTLTFRRGSGGFGFGVALLTLASGAYFPLQLLPHWVSTLARINPISLAIGGMRETLLGGVSLGNVTRDLLTLAPLSAASLTIGLVGFRLALIRERLRGSLGLY